MIGVLLSVLALVGAFVAGRRSLGQGLGFTLAVGYAYGVLRANVPDGGSHFMFDGAMVGLYSASFLGHGRAAFRYGNERAWVVVLIAWPLLMALVPFHHYLIQLVGLRSAIFFLPLVLLGVRAKDQDLDLLVKWIVGLNLIALSFGVAEFLLGIERFYPYNAVTELIYRSNDVGSERHHRIPATFPNAHAYGGTMVATLPLLLGRLARLEGGRERWLTIAATVAAGIGVFLCATRLAAVGLFVVGGFAVSIAPGARRVKVGFAALVLVVALVVAQSDRLQRFSSLSDTDAVASRLQGSLNRGLLDIVAEHPLGAGLGSAFGTSIPYFLQHLAPRQIGMENEYGRIALEQSLFGLALWLAFIAATLLHRSRRRTQPNWQVMLGTMRCFVAFCWTTALIGTGLLTSIPGTFLVLLGMGLLWNDGAPVRARPPMRRAAVRQAALPARAG